MPDFSIPRNIPSFSNPQREIENRVWAASGMASGPVGTYAYTSSGINGVQNRIGGYFGKNKDLPMYKDKPFSYATTRRYRPFWKRKRIFALVGFFIISFLYFRGYVGNNNAPLDGKHVWDLSRNPEKPGKVNWLSRRERVVEAFKLSWDAYERYAWGLDEFHPVSKGGRQMAPNGMGWIIVDSLDTLILMNLTDRLTKARYWMSTKLNFDQDQDVNTFETTIRILGGLLSAHYLSTEFPDLAPLADENLGTEKEDLYLELAKDLADRIIGAFDSPSGIPYASVNLKTFKGIESHTDGGASSTAEATTVQLELKYMSNLTGENYYWAKAEKAIQVVDDNGMIDGLLPIFISPTTGHFRGDNIRLGSRGDSYYEYLLKQYLQTSKNEPVYKEMWDQALSGVRKHLITYSKPSGFTVLGERPNGLTKSLSPKMDHLVCFMPGTIALGATEGLTEAEAKKSSTWTSKNDEDMKLARELMQTCWGMYKAMKTGLAAEITYFNVDYPPPSESAPHNPPEEFNSAEDAEWRQDFMVKPFDHHNLQRPETVESLFYMWRITGDVKYREWGWEMFKSFVNYTAVNQGGGFTSLKNANTIPPEQLDNMESFWLAETLKYFYLLFSPDDLLPLDKVVINTEAHPFPRFEPGPLFSTGWKRKPRNPEGKILPDPSN